MLIEVVIRDPRGGTHCLSEEWATRLAEELHRLPKYDEEAARSAARKIEARLIGDDDTPIEFDQDERLEVSEKLNAGVFGNAPDALALHDALDAE